ncbi:MAG: cupin domain-containing protein [Candidatus Omnitrophica bacterium]|nr:cupin domain-containing protein [Candidatus Omnitrophota bacterium]
MAKIKIEKPDQGKLDSLGVKSWNPWECGVSTFDWEYDSDEVCYILEGKVKVKTQEEEVEINRGDLVTFPSGLKCTWNVLQKIRKVYTFDK